MAARRPNLPEREIRNEPRTQQQAPAPAARPRVNNTLRGLVMLAIAFLLVVIVSLIAGEVMGIEEVSSGVKTFAVTSSVIFGTISLIILSVFDQV